MEKGRSIPPMSAKKTLVVAVSLWTAPSRRMQCAILTRRDASVDHTTAKTTLVAASTTGWRPQVKKPGATKVGDYISSAQTTRGGFAITAGDKWHAAMRTQ